MTHRPFPQIALGQVSELYPETYEVGVWFSSLATMLKVRVAPNHTSTPEYGDSSLPQKGQWGIVIFYQDDERSAIWEKTLRDSLNNAYQADILMQDPRAVAEVFADLSRRLHTSTGDTEHLFADGTLLRFSSTKDGTKSNTTGRNKKTPFTKTIPGEKRTRKRTPLENPSKPPLDIHLQHASGATLTLTADGTVLIQTARGHKLRLYDATEKARSTEDGSVTSTPDEDAQRIASEIVLQSEMGHKITLHDDPQVAEINRHITIQSALGHKIIMKDKPDDDQHIKIQTNAGHQIEMRDTAPTPTKKITVKTPKGLMLELHDTNETAKLLTQSGYGLTVDEITGTVTLKGLTIIHDATIALKLGGAGATKGVFATGDTDTRGDGHTASTTKVFIE